MNFFPTLFEIARHELAVILRTRRAVLIAALYLGAAVLGGSIYVLVVRTLEQQAIETFVAQGMDEETARQNLELAAAKGYEQLAELFSGVDDIDDMAASLKKSVILPIFFWGSLAFLPFVILLTSFDQLSSELNARSLCYTILRARRATILLGKVLAHTVLFVVLSAAGSAALVLVASVSLESVDFTASVWGLFRVWLLLIPFGLCYLSISSFASSLNTQSVPALITAVGIVMTLRVFSWLRHIPEESTLGFLQNARWLSPAHYEDGLWLAGYVAPAQSAGAYLLFALVFLTLGVARLNSRDL